MITGQTNMLGLGEACVCGFFVGFSGRNWQADPKIHMEMQGNQNN